MDKNNKQKRELDYIAKLIVYGIPSFNKKETKRFVKWLRSIADEIEKEDLNIFSNLYRTRLMK